MNISNLNMTQAMIEIFGGFICLMFAVIIILNGHNRDSWKNLKRMFLTTAGIFFFESGTYIFRGNTDKLSIVMSRISNFGLFLFDTILIIMFVNYLYSLLQEKGVTPRAIYKNIVGIHAILEIIIVIGNLFTKWMYEFDESNYYHRNMGWYVYTLLSLICMLTTVIMILKYRKTIRKTMVSALMFYVLVPIIAIIIQTFIFGISITTIGIFVALFFIQLTYLKEWSGTKEVEEKKRKSFETIVLSTIMAISMSASIISCIVSIGRISDENSESNSMLISHMINNGIENEFLKPVMVAETMSNDYFLKEYMKKSGEESPESVENDIAAYLDSIRTGFGYQMVYAVCDASKTYYTYNGIDKQVDMENDLWYKGLFEQGKSYELDVYTDADKQRAVFVNNEITDNKGNLLGVCGVGIEMERVQSLLKDYEKDYNVKIDLIDKDGLIQLDSDVGRIEKDYIDNTYLEKVDSDEVHLEKGTKSNRTTKYMKELGWYLVVEDCNQNKAEVFAMTTTSVIIFVIGLIMMEVAFFVISVRERKISEELTERKRLSITDDLTGLFNRRAYEEDCKKILEDNLFSKTIMIMMDVNGLKKTNDTYGHMAGDELIIGAAKCIQATMGEYGRVYRTGGDEFIALIECTKSQLEDMLGTFEHITKKWKGTYQGELTISKGIVVCREHEDMAFDDIKKMADKLMYEDKDAYYRRTGEIRRNAKK